MHNDACKEGKLQVLRNIGSGHHQTSRDEGKITERLTEKNEKDSWNQNTRDHS